MEVGYFVFRQITVTVKKTLPRYHNGIASKHTVIWEIRLEYACDWVDDSVMDRILQKEKDTRMFRLPRRILRKRRGWMLKSRASKLEVNQFRVGRLRACTCNYLFSSRWKKQYTIGMRRKRAAQSAWRRLRF